MQEQEPFYSWTTGCMSRSNTGIRLCFSCTVRYGLRILASTGTPVESLPSNTTLLTGVADFRINDSRVRQLRRGIRSVTIGRAVDLFEPVSKKFRIYHRIGPRRHDLMELPIMVGDKPEKSIPGASVTPRLPVGFVEMLNRFLPKKYAPASVLITRRYEILSQQ